jgi:uncharacterized protein involved in tellurium resistance
MCEGYKNVSKIRGRYLKALDRKRNDALEDDALEKERTERALKRAYELRTFEIELYWKRATYFWGFQIAIFAAFGLIWKGNSASVWGPITLALAGLGILTALANCLSARGSKFWQENWEKHIDMLEDDHEGSLYKTVWLDEGRRGYSVSKINRQLSWYFVVFWALVVFYVVVTLLRWSELSWAGSVCFTYIYVSIILIMILLGGILLFAQTSRLAGTLLNDDGSPRSSTSLPSWWHKRIRGANAVDFVSRYAPDEEPR